MPGFFLFKRSEGQEVLPNFSTALLSLQLSTACDGFFTPDVFTLFGHIGLGLIEAWSTSTSLSCKRGV